MSFTLKINQTVLLNLSDHFTRNKIQNSEKSSRIAGAIIGRQEGRVMHILNSTELVYEADTKNDKIIKLDMEFLKTRINLISQVFKDYDFLGWYTTLTPNHTQLDESDIEIHKLIAEQSDMNENPILLCMNPYKKMSRTKQLAVQCFELKILNEKTGKQDYWQNIQYDIDVDQSEAITIDSLLKNQEIGSQSQFCDNLKIMKNSLQNLQEKIHSILQLLESNPKIKKNQKLMRELKEIINSYPKKPQSDIDFNILENYCETNLTNLMSAVLMVDQDVREVINQRGQFDNIFRNKKHDLQ